MNSSSSMNQRATLAALAAGLLALPAPAVAQLGLLDSTPPTVTFRAPAEGAMVAGEVAIEVTASDGLPGIGVADVAFQADRTTGPWTGLSYNLVSNSYRGTWSVAALADGGHSLFVRATDYAGNVQISSVTVVVAQPPATPVSVRVTAPAAPSNGGQLNVSWTANTDADLAGYFVYRSNAFAGPYARIANVTSPSYLDGQVKNGSPQYYAIAAYDFSGNESKRSAPVSGTALDTQAPRISGVAVNVPTVDRADVSWITDEGATSQVLYGQTPDLGSATTQVIALRTNHAVAITGLEASTTYYFQVRSTDAAGNASTSELGTFQTGVDLPPSLSIVSPADGAVISGPARLQARATDDRGIDEAEYTIDGFAWSELPYNSLSGYYEASLDAVPEGAHQIGVRVTDTAGNAAQQVISVMVDRGAPAVELVTPELDAHLVSGQPHTVSAHVTDGSLASVEWQVIFIPPDLEVEATPEPDPAGWQPMTYSPSSLNWEAPWNTPLVVVEQVVFVYVRATDAGGRSTIVSRESTLIATGQDFSFIGTTGQELSGTVSIEPIAADGGNLIGIQVVGRTLTPGGDYTITVQSGGQAHSVSFRADGRGRGVAFVQEQTGIADELSAQIVPSGPGF